MKFVALTHDWQKSKKSYSALFTVNFLIHVWPKSITSIFTIFIISYTSLVKYRWKSCYLIKIWNLHLTRVLIVKLWNLTKNLKCRIWSNLPEIIESESIDIWPKSITSICTRVLKVEVRILDEKSRVLVLLEYWMWKYWYLKKKKIHIQPEYGIEKYKSNS